MQPIPELLFLALDFYRDPRRFDQLRQPGGSLPPGVGELLSAPNHCLNDDNIEATAATLAVPAQDCRDAVIFFIKQVMFEVAGDYYRVLGVERDAEQAQIKEHYFYLMRLFHPDRDVEESGWDDVYAPRINEAYNVLRNPGKRAAYDATLAQTSGFGELPNSAPGAAPGGQAAGAGVDGAAPDGGPHGGVARDGSGRPSVFRSPWLYAGFAALCVLVLFTMLFSNQTPQLTVAAGLDEERRFPREPVASDEPPEQAADTMAAADTQQASAGQTVASVQQASDAEIEAMVQARVDSATRAVLGAPRPAKSRAKPKPQPKPQSIPQPQANPEPASAGPAQLAQAEELATEQVTRLAYVQATGRAPPRTEPKAPAPVVTAEPAAAAAPVSAAPVSPVSASEEIDEETGEETATADARAPAAQPVTDAELEDLLLAFSYHYEFGDADAFAELFAMNAKTTDATGRKEIQRLYAGFFADNTVEGVRFSKQRWQQGADLRAGSAWVSITTSPASGGDATTVETRINFEVARSAQGAIEITRMSY